MNQPYTGGCACGAIRYAIAAEPIFTNHCQCRDCQQESGTGHGSHLTFPRDAVTLTGSGKPWDMRADSGKMKTRYFCAECGSPVYMTFAAAPEVFTVRAASLDDPARFVAQVVTYHARAYAWDQLDPTLTAYAGMPG